MSSRTLLRGVAGRLCQPARARACLATSAASAAPAQAPSPLQEAAGASPWLAFLSRLHERGYFGGEDGGEEGGGGEGGPAAVGPAASSAKGLVRRFGSPGDHKRAVLAFARVREGALPGLPQQALASLVRTPLPRAVVDSVFGGRKAVNAVKRLRATLGLSPTGNCVAERSPHAAQGVAGLSDAVRLVLIWHTSALPPDVETPVAALDALLHAFIELTDVMAVPQPLAAALAAAVEDDVQRQLAEAARRGAARSVDNGTRRARMEAPERERAPRREAGPDRSYTSRLGVPPPRPQRQRRVLPDIEF